MGLLENQTPEEQGKTNPLSSNPWLAEVKASQEWMSKWHTQARRITKRYLDRRDDNGEQVHKLNIFTSNVQILIATLYAKFPRPLVTREYEDQDDDVARVAAEIVERSIKVRPRDDFDSAMKYVVQDRLVPGAGSIWLRYEADTSQIEIPAVILPDGTEESPASIGEQIDAERVVVDYVFWEDLLWSPARTWETVRWVGRVCKMSRADATKRFGDVIAATLSFSKAYKGSKENDAAGEHPEGDQVQYATVYEIWCKRTKTVYWVANGSDNILDKKPDLLNLKTFFPTPRPMLATTSTSNMIPRPDFLLCQDQYEELDNVNNRITWLERAIKAVGVYDGTNTEIERIFTEGVDNKIIPMRSFSEFMEKGGMKGAIDWVPIEMFVNALDKLRTYRQDLISQIYEFTGISDIMRGSTKASETLGAQQLKAQYGSVKLQFLQMEVASFVEEALQMKSEIILNKFAPENIVRIANVANMTKEDQEFVQPAIELLKGGDWQYRIEVHADSMAVPEFNAERDARMAFMRSIAEMMTAAAPLVEKEPGAGVAMLRMVQWASASFRTGRTVEGILDTAVRQIEESVKAPKPPPPPDPSIQIAETKAKVDSENNVRDNETKLKIAFEDRGAEDLRNDKKMAFEQSKFDRESEMKKDDRYLSSADKDADRSDKQSERNTKEVEARTPAVDIQGLVEPIKEAAEAQMQSTQILAESIGKLAESVMKPRRRVPKRGPDGSILSIDEVPSEE